MNYKSRDFMNIWTNQNGFSNSDLKKDKPTRVHNALNSPKFVKIPQEFLLGEQMISEFFKNAYIPLLALSSLELENDCRYLNTSKCPPLAAMSKTLVHP